MTKGIIGKEPDPEIVYADIFHHPHHQSETHPQMSLYDRAAQFAPFAALTGYDDMINEEARYVDEEIQLEESDQELLNQKLSLLADQIESGSHPTVSIKYFEPDKKKSGGKYVTVKEEIKKVDAVKGQLILSRTQGPAGTNFSIDFNKISEIHGDLVDYIDDTML